MTTEHDECPGCGSRPSDRQTRIDANPGDEIPITLSTCERCGNNKCCMCDMGDDVECPQCHTVEDFGDESES